MTLRQAIVLMFALLFTIAPSLVASSETISSSTGTVENEIIASVSETWADNWSRFDTMICRYELTQWITDSMESEANGEKNLARGFAECDWRKHGEHQLLIMNADPVRNPESFFDGKDGFTYGVKAYGSKIFLLDGMLWMSLDDGYGTIHMSGGVTPHALTPYSLTNIPLFQNSSRTGDAPTAKILQRENDAVGMMRVKVQLEEDHDCELSFDMNNNALLTQAIYKNKEGELRIDVLNYQECTNGGFFPVHIRRSSHQWRSLMKLLLMSAR